jgi:hypothetical protein
MPDPNVRPAFAPSTDLKVEGNLFDPWGGLKEMMDLSGRFERT